MIVDVSEWDVMYGDIQWGPLDGDLVDLVKRHKCYGNLIFQIATTVDQEVIRRSLPRAAQEGVLEVSCSKRPNYFA